MKKVFASLILLFVLILTNSAKAQLTGADFFAGKWNVLLKGIPGGDRTLLITLEKKDSTITGTVQDAKGTELSKITRADLKENELTIYFFGEGYDLSLFMAKKDEDHITGRLIDRFDAEGERVK